MSWSSIDSGSKTADGTEQTLSTQTTSGTYVFGIDTANMANGDVIEIRIKTKMRSGDSSQLAYFVSYANAQSELNKYSVAIAVDVEIVVTLKQTAGTNRTYLWALLRT